eukprot:gene20713-27525_t
MFYTGYAARDIVTDQTEMMNQCNAARDIVTDQTKMMAAVGGLTALAVGIYGARESTRVIGRTVDRWLGTPRLVRETSRFNIWDTKTWTSAYRAKTYDEVKRDFSDIILPAALHNNVRQQAAAAGNTKRHGAPFRHMLFYGPPGTGKTMAAKRLARTSGLDYAIMSGGDVAPLGGKAVTQLHEVFDWSERSRRGLLLFIDEADAFLGKRTDEMSEGLRGALNALLYRTGDQSRDFLVVLATNRPGDLDSAVLDRMDEALDFGLPGPNERKKILDLYLDRYITKAGTAEGEAGSGVATSIFERFSSMLRGRSAGAEKIKVNGIDDAMILEAAKATEGFSGRELAKFMAAVQASVYGSEEVTLTAKIFRSVLARKLTEHGERANFRKGHHGTGASVIKKPSPMKKPTCPKPPGNTRNHPGPGGNQRGTTRIGDGWSTVAVVDLRLPAATSHQASPISGIQGQRIGPRRLSIQYPATGLAPNAPPPPNSIPHAPPPPLFLPGRDGPRRLASSTATAHCGSCGLVAEFSQAYTVAGRNYHMECFKCCSCSALLTADPSPPSSTVQAIVNERTAAIFCPACAQQETAALGLPYDRFHTLTESQAHKLFDSGLVVDVDHKLTLGDVDDDVDDDVRIIHASQSRSGQMR